VLPTALISRTLRLDPRAPLFTDAVDGARTMVLTTAEAAADRRAALAEVADVVVCGADSVDPVAVRAALEERGHRRILAEGGPTVFAELAAAGVVDELCLSLTPFLVGPGPAGSSPARRGRPPGGSPWPVCSRRTPPCSCATGPPRPDRGAAGRREPSE
jgi:riboflavin biosynthesis pyrimidine reductase